MSSYMIILLTTREAAKDCQIPNQNLVGKKQFKFSNYWPKMRGISLKCVSSMFFWYKPTVWDGSVQTVSGPPERKSDITSFKKILQVMLIVTLVPTLPLLLMTR